jgi:DNA-binding MarR family transcriptional regulator
MINNDFLNVLLQWSGVFARRSIHDFLRFAHEQNLSMPQISLLMTLYYRGPASIAELRQEMYGTPAAASQLIDRMVDNRLVERVESPQDRRLKIISLTEDGRTLVEKGIAARRKWLEDLAESFTPEQKIQVEAVLSTMIESALALDRG